jgi:hypothetical protein
MKKFIIRGELLDGSVQEFEFHHINFIMNVQADKVTYIKYQGANYPVKTETIEFLKVWKATAHLTYVGTGDKTSVEQTIKAADREEAEKKADQWSATFDHQGYVVDAVVVE